MPKPLRLLLIASCACGAYAQELKLEQAIQLALQHNAEIANALLEVEKAGDRIAALHTRLLPSAHFSALAAQQLRPVNFTIQRGQLGDFASTGPIPSSDVQFSTPLRPTGILSAKLAQPLSGIYKTRLNLRLLDISRQIAREQARSSRQDVVQAVRKVYFEIQRIESSLTVAREMVALFRETDRLTASRLVQQVVLEADHLEAQTNLVRAEQEELTLGNQSASAREQLNQLMGREVTAEFTVSPLAERVDAEVELAVARRQAIEQRPEVRVSRLKMEEARQQVKLKRSDYIPDISAEVNSMSLLNFSSFLPSHTTSAGISLSWEPFDWGRKKYELAEKQRSVTQARNTEADARGKVLVDVDDKFRKLQQIRAQFRVARLSQRTAAERLRVATKRYQVEAALLKAVLESQTSLQQANDDYAQTLAKLWTAQAEFHHAIGEDQ
jgi:outer membrane protein TolC